MLRVVIKRWSHVGRRPITIEPGVSVSMLPPPNQERVSFGRTGVSVVAQVTGPLGKLDFPIHRGLKTELVAGMAEDERMLKVMLDGEVYPRLSRYCQRFVKAMWGTTASFLRQHVEGVTEVSLRLVGVGYKASVEEGRINLKVGYTHEMLIPIPDGIRVTMPANTKIVLFGSDYQKVTQFAAKIREKKKPEPYNGKGIFVGNETIRLKEGKKK